MVSISGSGTGSAAPTRASARSISRRALTIGGAALLFTTLGGAAAPGALDISFASLRSQKGLIQICLTAYPDNFPNCSDDKAAITRSIRAAEGSARIAGLPSGQYALALVHDENGNARLDTFAGIPREGIGFSRNPALGFGPPKFTAARFTIGTEPISQSVKLKYYL